jgi:nucleoside-diphosphate-sugar epimerase
VWIRDCIGPDMANSKDLIIVTGSSGFIGRAVCDAFVRDGFQVVGLDRSEAGSPPIGIEHIASDVTSDESMTAAVSRIRDTFGDRVASVIHLAAYYDFSGEPSSLYDEVTVRGTERLLRAIRPLEVGQFVFSSTMLVHAPCSPGEYIDESSPLEPKWDYPDSKLQAERIISAERGKVPAVMLRIAGVYTDRCESIPLAHQIQRIYERRLTSNVFPGDTSTGQSYVHLEDLVETGAARDAAAHG